MTEVAIVASAFGAQSIRRDGHAAWIGAVQQARASAFEVCGDLIDDAGREPAALRALGADIARAGLWPVWSTCDALYDDEGCLDENALDNALTCARALGARFAALQLGGFARDPQIARLRAVLAAAGGGLRVVVENGQRARGGSLAQFIAFFAALRRESGALERVPVGMAFDIGNWQWPGEPPLLAAAALAPRVEYIHCKAVAAQGANAQRVAVAPAAADPLCRAAFALLPREVPRGIEFEFDPACVAADAARYVEWLGAA